MNQPNVATRIGMCLLGFLTALGFWFGVVWVVATDAGGLLADALVDESAASVEASEFFSRGRAAVREHCKGKQARRVLAGDDAMPGCGFTLEELEGRHYVLANAVIDRGDGEVELVAIPLAAQYPLLRLRFRVDAEDTGVVSEISRP